MSGTQQEQVNHVFEEIGDLSYEIEHSSEKRNWERWQTSILIDSFTDKEQYEVLYRIGLKWIINDVIKIRKGEYRLFKGRISFVYRYILKN